MARLEIPRPPWAQGQWSWPWPPADAGILGTQAGAWLGASVSSAVTWAQRSALEWWTRTAAARDLRALPPGVIDGLAAVAQAPMVIANADDAASVRIAIVDAMGDALSLTRTISDSLGAARGVPILGWVIGLVQTGLSIASSIMREKRAAQQVISPTAYDPDAAIYFQSLVLDLATRDPERVFLPWGHGRVISRRTTTGSREWAQAERGEGMGFVPEVGLPGFAKSNLPGRIYAVWAVDTDEPPEAYYRHLRWYVRPAWAQPGTIEACATVWQRCQEAPGCYDIAPSAIVKAWDEWERAWLGYRGTLNNEGSRARMWGALYVLTPTPTQAVTVYRGKVYAQSTPQTVWIAQAERLRRVQHDATRTIAGAAYSSEEQRAFARDPDLRARLYRARAMLLHHPAVSRVNPDAVPDADYRAAIVATQRRRSIGPVGLAGKRPTRRPRPQDPMDLAINLRGVRG